MSTSTTLSMSGSLTIQCAADQHAVLKAALASNISEIDLSAITECDTAGVQLLLAAEQEARSQGRSLTLHRLSEPVRETLSRYGLDALLATPNLSEERP